ncbi:hypothetical protein EZV62_013198 [Acer yangbiense]|uniref:PGG domain-containing protein n=1 Tax=Acer yangbiense TaxID=1000413 RepID=A0A5C7HYA7_9ROSI|nr:hypothetical protein EZV62_013198 [Acer yangbiense]
MERRIYEAAIEGSVVYLFQLLQEDALLLDRLMVGCYAETPLHIASMLGHLDSVQEILTRKPEPAGVLDSRKSSPLHLAAAKGYIDIVKSLISVNPETCFVSDRDGRNPLDNLTSNKNKTIQQHLQGNDLENVQEKGDDWLEKKRSVSMVVASLIATVTFQAGLNPPCGVRQETGYSVLYDRHRVAYILFLAYNTTGFVSSLSIILLLISGLPVRRKCFVWILMMVILEGSNFSWLGCHVGVVGLDGDSPSRLRNSPWKIVHGTEYYGTNNVNVS